MKRLRWFPALLAAILGLCVMAPTASEAAKAKPRERKLDAAFTADIMAPPGRLLPTTGAITMWVPRGVRNAGDKMAFCDPAAIQARGLRTCPLRSIVGSGKASGLIVFISQTAVEPLRVTLVNGPGNTLLAHVFGTNPVSIDVVIQSVIRRLGGKYGMELYFPFPDELIHPVPGSTASLIHLESRLDPKAGWLRSTSCPTRGWSLGAMLSNIDGSATKITADLACV